MTQTSITKRGLKFCLNLSFPTFCYKKFVDAYKYQHGLVFEDFYHTWIRQYFREQLWTVYVHFVNSMQKSAIKRIRQLQLN